MSERLKEAARLYAAREFLAAEAVCRGIIRDDPTHFDALHLLGVLLSRQDRHDEAVTWLRLAEAERPDDALLLVNLGNALLATKRYQDVIDIAFTGNADALNNFGLAYRGLGQHEAAESAFHRATVVRWDHAGAWFNLANTLTALGRLEESLVAARTAQRVAPLDTSAHRLADVTNEIGRTLMALGRPADALVECRRFLKRHPDQHTVTWNLSLCLLLLGRFEEGWRAYEHRFDVPDHDRPPEGTVVLDLRRIAGKRVLILTEQGRGDMVQFIRYAPLLTAMDATVCVQAYPDLVRLLASMPGVASVISTDDALPEADFVTPVMSLPLAFGSHPPDVPYLRVPAGLAMGPRTRPRIGVAWSGSTHSYDRSAMPVESLAPLLALPDFEFHCLQPKITDRDQAWLDANKPPLQRHKLSDFADTAALIEQMDAVVTIDTAVAHLAGALAKPVSVMLPFNPDWRWLLGRTDSPWYPTARLFRQPVRGAWGPVVQAVIDAGF